MTVRGVSEEDGAAIGRRAGAATPPSPRPLFGSAAAAAAVIDIYNEFPSCLLTPGTIALHPWKWAYQEACSAPKPSWDPLSTVATSLQTQQAVFTKFFQTALKAVPQPPPPEAEDTEQLNQQQDAAQDPSALENALAAAVLSNGVDTSGLGEEVAGMYKEFVGRLGLDEGGAKKEAVHVDPTPVGDEATAPVEEGEVPAPAEEVADPAGGKEVEVKESPAQPQPQPQPQSQLQPPSGMDVEEFKQDWERRRKHVFIFSDASRPIYTRYGDETEFLDFFGMMGLIVSVSHKAITSLANMDKREKQQGENHETRFLKAGNKTYVFVKHQAIHYLVVASTGETVTMLQEQLHFLNALLLSILTKNVYQIFERRSNYDLRSLLGGSADNLMRGALRLMNNNPSFGLSAIPVLRLKKTTRDHITKTLKTRLRDCGADLTSTAYSFLLYHIPEGRYPYGGTAQSNNTLLVTYLSDEKAPIHPRDFSIFTNFLQSSLPPASKYQEIWSPCCLPEFSSDGFLYVYMTFITPTVSFSCISRTNDAFTSFSAVKDALVHDFSLTARDRVAAGVPAQEPTSGAIHEVVTSKLYSVSSMEGLSVTDEVLHFMFKDSTIGQFTASRFTPPFVGKKEQKGLLRLYLKAREAALACQGAKKTMIYSTEYYAVLVRIGRNYELLATFRPLTTKQQMSVWARMLKKWVRQQQTHDALFAPPGPMN